MITYTWLDNEGLIALEPYMMKMGWTSLNGKTARALIAHDGPTLAGFIIVQLLPHTEPLYVEPAYRGTGLAEELAKQMRGFMEEINSRAYMVVADSPAAIKICEENGMRLITSPVYLKVGE